MYTITLETGFSATHGITYVDGPTEPQHQHDWIVRAAVTSENLDNNGLAIDFLFLKEKLDAIIRLLEGTELETLKCFADKNASAENVARYIFDQLEPHISQPAKLVSVEIMEAPGCWAKYSQ